MLGPILYYLVLPFLAAYLVLRFLRRYASHEIPRDVAALYEAQPLEKGWFRAVRRDERGRLSLLEDCETRPEAVESAYRGLEQAKSRGEKASFVVLDDQGQALEQVDS